MHTWPGSKFLVLFTMATASVNYRACMGSSPSISTEKS